MVTLINSVDFKTLNDELSSSVQERQLMFPCGWNLSGCPVWSTLDLSCVPLWQRCCRQSKLIKHISIASLIGDLTEKKILYFIESTHAGLSYISITPFSRGCPWSGKSITWFSSVDFAGGYLLLNQTRHPIVGPDAAIQSNLLVSYK